MNDKQNQTKPSEQEAGYENAWNSIQAHIFAHGLNEARLKARSLLDRGPSDPLQGYEAGVVHAFQHFLARHNAKLLRSVGEPCL